MSASTFCRYRGRHASNVTFRSNRSRITRRRGRVSEDSDVPMTSRSRRRARSRAAAVESCGSLGRKLSRGLRPERSRHWTTKLVPSGSIGRRIRSLGHPTPAARPVWGAFSLRTASSDRRFRATSRSPGTSPPTRSAGLTYVCGLTSSCKQNVQSGTLGDNCESTELSESY